MKTNNRDSDEFGARLQGHSSTTGVGGSALPLIKSGSANLTDRPGHQDAPCVGAGRVTFLPSNYWEAPLNSSVVLTGVAPQINPHNTDARIEGHMGETRDERLQGFRQTNPGVRGIGLREGTMLTC